MYDVKNSLYFRRKDPAWLSDSHLERSGLQKGKALFILQLGKGVCNHIQPSSLLCSLLIPFSAWGSTQVETLQGPGDRVRRGSWDMALEILWGTISPLQYYFENVLSRTMLLSSEKTKKRTRRALLS